jgi:hypothetical protein
MIWHILGAVSLFFNIVKTDKIVSNNSELILTNKTKLVSDKTKIASSTLIYKNKEILNKLLLKKDQKLVLVEPTRDTIHNENISNSFKELREIKATQKIDITTYRIFFNGRIEKHIPKVVAAGNENKYKYEYIAKEGKTINLGSYKIHKTKTFRGSEDEYVNLINLEVVPKFFKQNNYQYHFNIDSRRSFVNEQTLASFFGAMLEVNYLDISCNGFSHKDGSSKPSRSHINGNNGDFKYLRSDKTLECGPGTSLNISKAPDSLDYSRQNKWNDALYKFGWKKMLGWTYTLKKTTKHLHHITHKTTNHHHHLHVQNYEPDFKEIKQ